MGRRHDFLRVLQGTQGQSSDDCGDHKWCEKCLSDASCNWCEGGNAVAAGSCHALTEDCGNSLVTEDSQCPHVGTDVVLKNISGLIGAMLGLVICLNVLNRFLNKRRNRKLKNSIFKLPVYTYPSRERRAAALREARSILDASSKSTVDVEDGSLQGEDSSVTCAICLASYEDEEVIKVLPCEHDFHAHCLDCWLEMKATCPLCKAPAFSNKWRETPRRNSSESQVHAVNTLATEPSSGPGPGPGQAVADSPSVEHQNTDGDNQISARDTGLVRTGMCTEIEETEVPDAGAEDGVESIHRVETVRKDSIIVQGDHDKSWSTDVGRGDDRGRDVRHGEVDPRLPLHEPLATSLVTRAESQSCRGSSAVSGVEAIPKAANDGALAATHDRDAPGAQIVSGSGIRDRAANGQNVAETASTRLVMLAT